ncbi:MAG: choice-of-anchor J domain-containing protein [Pyrinomonadaceae bacterium]
MPQTSAKYRKPRNLAINLPVFIILTAVFLFGVFTVLPAGERVAKADGQNLNAAEGPCVNIVEGFNNVSTLPPNGWSFQNLSQPLGSQANWFQGDVSIFTAQFGATNSYISANFNNGADVATISNWLLMPETSLVDGSVLSFYARTVSIPAFPDRLQVRMSTAGSSTNVGISATDVGDFTTLLLDVNPTYLTSGTGSFPSAWTQFTVVVSGVPTPITGRLCKQPLK